MNTFQEMNLPEALQEALKRMEYHTPTEIQAQAIPMAMKGHDILGSAQTGTGKTAAFSIPLVNKLIEDPNATALVLTPTRELAEQVITFLHQLLNKRRDIKTVLLIGGVAISKQFLRLKDRPRIIVGTPGRINDHLERRSINFSNNRILVLDEADRMLDMGFGEQLEIIAKHLPTERQTFMFSATMPKRIMTLAQKFLNNPERIKIGATHAPLEKIKQDIVRTSEDGKYFTLLKELEKRTGSIIIFAKTKRKVDTIANKLKEKMGAAAMHGDLRQHQRTRILKEFRDQKYRVLVATDVAARGLDIPHIEHVINYDLPQAPEDYIHRIGRTARGNAEGSALCFISREDEKYWRAIERLLGGDESAPSVRFSPGKPRSSAPRSKPRFGEKRYESRFNDGKPRSNSRFADRGDENRERSSEKKRFGERDGDTRQRTSEGKRFGEQKAFGKRNNEGRARPGERQRFDERSTDNRQRSGESKPFGEKRFGERNTESRQRPGENKRFGERNNDGRPRSSEPRRFSERNSEGRSRPGEQPRFSERNSEGRSRPGEQPRFSERNSERRSRPGEQTRFSERNNEGRSRPTEQKREAKKPVSNPTRKSYGPQNRPPKAKKPSDEAFLNY